MKKEYKILLWVLLGIIIIYLLIRWRKGYFTLGYIPLLGYQARIAACSGCGGENCYGSKCEGCCDEKLKNKYNK